MLLLEPSEEQNNIINSVLEYNITIDAVAGSGKTTTILHIGKRYPEYNILVMTYNKRLKQETRSRVSFNNIKNIQVENYHSFCIKKYNELLNDTINSYTDELIINVIKNNTKKEFNYDVIIIDEAQDMSILYYELMCHIINDNKKCKTCHICVFGDIKQSIYGFNNADYRYLKYSNKLFDFNDFKWRQFTLSETFRLTKENVDFINNIVLQENRLVSKNINNNIRTCSKPRYIFCNSYSDRVLYEIIHYYLGSMNFAYTFNDIFILAPSIKSDKSPIKCLSNKLSFIYNIPIYIPNSDEEQLDDDIIKDKIVFSTFHQVKGLERKIIIIFSFDNSYFEYYNRNAPKHYCSNEIYVALTRATERISVIHDYKYNFLDFLNIHNIEKYCDNDNLKLISLFDKNNKILNFKYNPVQDNKKNIFSTLHDSLETSEKIIDKIMGKILENKKTNNIISITNFIKHLPYNIINKVLENIEIITEKKSLFSSDSETYEINIETKIKQDNLYENVSEITGIAIPAYYEYITTNKISILNIINLEISNNNKLFDFIHKEHLDFKNINCNNILKISNIYNSIINDLCFKIQQIKYYNWLDDELLHQAMTRLKKNISSNPVFESCFISDFIIDSETFFLKGFIDCIDDKNVWELKFTKNLTNTHIIQLALYMFLFKQKYPLLSKKFYLFNIYNGVKIEIKSSLHQLKKIINIIFSFKYKSKNHINNDLFIDNNLVVKHKYLSVS
jgi:hypothetical protein